MRHNTGGFTLIELLIVVVIISILAAIALPKFRTTKEEAYMSKMKGDLRNLATAQEAYSSDNGSYYNGAIPAAVLVYNPSQGVAMALANVTATGWGATASSPGFTTRTCAIYFGTGGPLGPATVEGRVGCTP
ncbi:MAG TPA: prepilin-type N-terminal cleavage/methylation domain-containing protein [Gemmatimonadales bacterium]|nr:prepilin-type N-terminal cleavage/methylation domain-containing protein [Gemmatimonadales bacterium]